jgi:hypothetical protein
VSAVEMSAFGVKRTSLETVAMSANDPKRTSLVALHMSAFDPKRTIPIKSTTGSGVKRTSRGTCFHLLTRTSLGAFSS